MHYRYLKKYTRKYNNTENKAVLADFKKIS